jgi:cystathionine beta-lyase/cystathionine gamma-synthase
MTHDLPRLGIAVTFVPGDDPAAWREAATPRTRVFYLESMTNPLLRIADLRAAAAFARERDIVSVVDNTFATPLGFTPLRNGFDLVLHSATKYLNGHSDLIAGAVMGTSARVREVKRTLDHLGGSLDPHACFLLQRGLKTLAVRFRQQCANALAVARALEQHPAVARVNHPGLESHPQHALARRQMQGGYGGIVTAVLRGGLAAARRTLERCRLFALAESLGGVESLIEHPGIMTHASLPEATRKALGIDAGLIRLSVGVEDVRDLTAELEQALAP